MTLQEASGAGMRLDQWGGVCVSRHLTMRGIWVSPRAEWEYGCWGGVGHHTHPILYPGAWEVPYLSCPFPFFPGGANLNVKNFSFVGIFWLEDFCFCKTMVGSTLLSPSSPGHWSFSRPAASQVVGPPRSQRPPPLCCWGQRGWGPMSQGSLVLINSVYHPPIPHSTSECGQRYSGRANWHWLSDPSCSFNFSLQDCSKDWMQFQSLNADGGAILFVYIFPSYSGPWIRRIEIYFTEGLFT